MWQELKEGFAHVSNSVPIRDILIFLATIHFLSVPYNSLLPVIARDILKGGPQALGLLMTGSAVGALIGSGYLASRKNLKGLGKALVFAVSIFSFGLICLGQSKIFVLSMAIMAVTGAGRSVYIAVDNTILQTLVDDDKRGRIMSYFFLAKNGTMPLGALLAGALGSWVGIPNTFLIGGGLCVFSIFFFSRRLPVIRKNARPVLIEKGLIMDEAL